LCAAALFDFGGRLSGRRLICFACAERLDHLRGGIR
jgi:hypothetical protein